MNCFIVGEGRESSLHFILEGGNQNPPLLVAPNLLHILQTLKNHFTYYLSNDFRQIDSVLLENQLESLY
jgi:hypothetical protein